MKRKTLRISCDFLIEWLQNPVPPGLTADGMPPDAVVLGASLDAMLGVVVLIIGSTHFADDGGKLTVRFHRDFQCAA